MQQDECGTSRSAANLRRKAMNARHFVVNTRSVDSTAFAVAGFVFDMTSPGDRIGHFDAQTLPFVIDERSSSVGNEAEAPSIDALYA